MVAVGAELHLEVALLGSEHEQLDDLEVPEPVRRAGEAGRRGVAVPGRVDPHDQLLAPRERDEDRFGGGHGLAAPGGGDAELHQILRAIVMPSRIGSMTRSTRGSIFTCRLKVASA